MLHHRGQTVLREGHDQLQTEVPCEAETGVDAITGELREGLIHDDNTKVPPLFTTTEIIDALEGREHGHEEGRLVLAATLFLGAFVQRDGRRFALSGGLGLDVPVMVIAVVQRALMARILSVLDGSHEFGFGLLNVLLAT